MGSHHLRRFRNAQEELVESFVSHALTASYILGGATVLFDLKSRICKENAWQAEMDGAATEQRQWEGYDKVSSLFIYVTTICLVIQAVGLELTSVLAIGGVGGLAMGLAGREICENLLNGMLVMSTNPFSVGDEVHFMHNGNSVAGIVMDIGWVRTEFRSFDREVFIIPNAIFSRSIILNVTRRNREYRFVEKLAVRLEDAPKVSSVIQDMRRLLKGDPRIINRLHRRVFLDELTMDACVINLSFYVDAPSRDAFLAIKEDFLLAFLDCVERNGAKPATPRTRIAVDACSASALAAALGDGVQGASGSDGNGTGSGGGGDEEDGGGALSAPSGGGLTGALAAQAQTQRALAMPPTRVRIAAGGGQRRRAATSGAVAGRSGPERLHLSAAAVGGGGDVGGSTGGPTSVDPSSPSSGAPSSDLALPTATPPSSTTAGWATTAAFAATGVAMLQLFYIQQLVHAGPLLP
ncbi:hypothetical protein FOA52_006537 [Chlamydomonas sp. UWO 241]|nr:hypothetical protein FOA52_006537 [Chlamydomonas sp. UWO 241]